MRMSDWSSDVCSSDLGPRRCQSEFHSVLDIGGNLDFQRPDLRLVGMALPYQHGAEARDRVIGERLGIFLLGYVVARIAIIMPFEAKRPCLNQGRPATAPDRKSTSLNSSH